MPDLVGFDDAPAERRAASRHRALVGAQIIYRNGNCAMNCQILDESDTGAMLRPADIFSVPAAFVLKPRFAEPRECRMVWRKGERLGVRYA